jgi:serum/glucocorticoid-regulated kinase 2
MYKV